MPIYCYRCDNCKQTFEVKHGMFFEQERCTICHKEGFLTKVFSPTAKIDKEKFAKKTGDVVKQHIEDAKKDIKEEKKKLSSREL